LNSVPRSLRQQQYEDAKHYLGRWDNDALFQFISPRGQHAVRDGHPLYHGHLSWCEKNNFRRSI